MNAYPASRDERRLREKQQEPGARDNSVRNHQRRGGCLPPGLVDDRWSEASDTDEEQSSADIEPAV